MRKKYLKQDQPQLRSKNRQKRILILLAALIILVALIAAISLNIGTQRQQLVLPSPKTYSHGLLVNNVSQSFAFEWEWNFNFTQGTVVNMTLILKGGTGVNAVLGPTDSKLNLVPPYLYTVTLKSSGPVKGAWNGTIESPGGYRLELGNLADENNPATVQVYVHAT